MNPKLKQFKERSLSTDYPHWRRVATTIFLAVMCIATVGIVGYLYATTAHMQCHSGFILVSIIWLFIELVLIAYMYKSSTIPRFARDYTAALIAFSNIWFGMFIIDLQSCAV